MDVYQESIKLNQEKASKTPKMSWKNTQQNSFADSLVIEHKSLSELYITPKPLTTF
jgi:hypothetical protein